MELQAIIHDMVTASPILVSYEESLLRAESQLEEVVNGELHIMPPASVPYNRLIRRIQAEIDRKLDSRLDLIWDTGFLISERPLRYRIPDLAIVERADSLWENIEGRDPYLRMSPFAVIEILSPANRKGQAAQLLQDYVDLGTTEMVFIDPEKQTVTINGELITGDKFSVAGVVLSLRELCR